MPLFFFLRNRATTQIYTLSLHDALPILNPEHARHAGLEGAAHRGDGARHDVEVGADEGRKESDRKSTRLNSSHTVISYAVFCLKKKNGLTGGLRIWAIVIANFAMSVTSR